MYVVISAGNFVERDFFSVPNFLKAHANSAKMEAVRIKTRAKKLNIRFSIKLPRKLDDCARDGVA